MNEQKLLIKNLPEKVKRTPKENIIDQLEEAGIDYQVYHGVSEPGYDDKELIVSNWNNVTSEFYNEVEKAFDNSVDWEDEWIGCHDCGKAIRCIGDSYGWVNSITWVSDCEFVCPECWEDNIEDIISHYANNTNQALHPGIFPLLEKAGFICYSPDELCARFESGMYPGQTDEPAKVAEKIEGELPDHDYIFMIESAGQFDLLWTVFLRRKEKGE